MYELVKWNRWYLAAGGVGCFVILTFAMLCACVGGPLIYWKTSPKQQSLGQAGQQEAEGQAQPKAQGQAKGQEQPKGKADEQAPTNPTSPSS